MLSNSRLSALALAIAASALTILAINCQSNPEPTPTTIPTPAPTATEAYVPPTLTPTRTPIPEPTATQVAQPTATPAPTAPTATATTAPEAADAGQIDAEFDFNAIAEQSAQQQDGGDTLYAVSLHVITSPDSQQTTLQLYCGTPPEQQQKCADYWEIGPELPTEQHITVDLPAGEHQITVQRDDAPVVTAIISIDPEAAGGPNSAWLEVIYVSEPGDPPELIQEILASWSESQTDETTNEAFEIFVAIEANEVRATESKAGPGPSGQVRRFSVPMIVLYESNLQPDDQPDTLQLFCRGRNTPRWKCAADLPIESMTFAEVPVSIQLPSGWHEVTVEDDGVPIAHALVSVWTDDNIASKGADIVVENESVTIDVYALNEFVPNGSNGVVPRLTGYWSDETATVEIFAGSQTINPNDSLICQIDGQPAQPCISESSLTTNGRYTRTEMRLPFGVTHLEVVRDDEPILSSSIFVSARTLGIHPDVLDCFTDTTFMDANAMPDQAIGCAGWQQPTINKWLPDRPLRVRVNGPDQWTTFFKTELEDLQTLFNIEFEWTQANEEAVVTATVGITREEALQQELGCSIEPNTAGCATTGISGNENHIVIYNLNPDANNPGTLPTSQTDINSLRTVILHEAVHLFTAMGHRIEVGTLMHSQANEFGGRGLSLSPMDHALVQLHAHPAVGGGRSIRDLRQFIIPSDELLDTDYVTPEPAPGWNAWQHTYRAFNALRNAASATYDVNASMPTCNLSISAATYQVAKLTPGNDTFQWSRIQSQQTNIVSLEHPDLDPETWSQGQTGWAPSDMMPESLGWIPTLSDPYNILVNMLLSADWSSVNVTNSDSTSITIATGVDWPAVNRAANVELTINTETNAITDYNLEWSRGTDSCDEYLVSATNGTYGAIFNFPDEVRTNSEHLSMCETHDLALNPRGSRVSGKWHQECPATMPDAAYTETYRFNTDTWSLLRLDFQAPDDAFLVLTDTASGNSQTFDRATDIPFLFGLERFGAFIEDVSHWQFNLPLHGSYAWHHQWLPPGNYEIQANSRERSFPGRFILIVNAQPISGPPDTLRFKAVATSVDRTCALLTDGTPLCWGRPRDTSQTPTIPQGKFENIYGGYHYCATNPEGEPQCWDFKEAGEYECTAEAGTVLSARCVDPDQPEFTTEGLIDESGGFVRGEFFDLTQPEGQSFLAISPGSRHTCGLRTDNTILCWGSNSDGESTPPTGTAITDIAISSGYSCGLNAEGLIQCWGEDVYGPPNTPTDTNFADFGISFSYGHVRTCGLDELGQVQCFTRRDFYCDPSKATLIIEPCFTNDVGEWLEPGDPGYVPSPPALYNPAPGQTFVALSSGAPECGIKADGTATCWHIWPNVGSPPPTETFTQISAGKHHACGLRKDGTIACWGDNHYGQSTPPNRTHLPSE